MAFREVGLLLAPLLLVTVRAGPWNQAPLLPVLAASSQRIPGEQCRQDYSLFLEHLSNFSLWAVEMFDSSTKIPEGLLAGSTYQLGHFDECIGIAANLGDRRIQGQYCIADIHYRQKGTRLPCSNITHPEDSAWQKLQWCGDRSKVKRDLLHWAICTPASCSSQDVQIALSDALVHLELPLGTIFNVSIPPEQCTVAEDSKQLGGSGIAFVCVLIVLSLIFLLSTVFDFTCCGSGGQKLDALPGGETEECNKCSPLQEIFLSFSARRNIPKLYAFTPCQPGLDFSHGVRFAFMFCIIMGHRLLAYVDQPFHNAEVHEELFQNTGGLVLANGPLVVDIYLFLSGVLIGFLLFKKLDKGEKINVFLAIVKFVVRVWPVYMLVIWFHSSVLSHIGSGPYWKTLVNREEQRCINSWWANLAFIQTYWDPQNMCLFTSWYIACHFHMYVICLLLVMLAWYRPKIGWSLMVVTTIASVIMPFFYIWWYRMDPIIKPFPDYGPDLHNHEVFYRFYVKTHFRATPYLLGAMTGIFLHKSRSSKVKIPKIPAYAIFYAAWSLGVGVILSCYGFLKRGYHYTPLASALYGSLQHVAMSFVCFVLFSITTFGDIRAMSRLFSSPVFIVLSRLTFNAYLIHFTPILYDQGVLQVPRYLSFYSATWQVVADVTIAYFLSFLAALMVEMPLQDLFKMLFYGKNQGKEES